MGYTTEVNTLLKLPSNFDTDQLKIGGKYTADKDNERLFPLHIAILIVTHDWNFLGYAVAHSATTKDYKTTIEFEVISLFSTDEQKIYKDKFLEAAKLTGEIK